MKQNFFSKLWIFPVIFCLSARVDTPPARAAKYLHFKYGAATLSVDIQDLETFATTGTAEDELGLYLNLFNPRYRSLLRSFLSNRYDMDAVQIDRIFIAQAGRSLFDNAGEIIRSDRGENGAEAMHEALVEAASSSEGLTPINVLEQFPTDILIDIDRILEVRQKLIGLIEETRTWVENLKLKTSREAESQPTQNFDRLPDLREPGAFEVSKQTLEFFDHSRDRQLLIDLYLPRQQQIQPVPLIVISNGIGAGRYRFSDLAEHLASHNFAVAIADHPGSNKQRQRDFFAGIHSDNFEPREFVDRPLDITFILDRLEQENNGQLYRQIDVENTGIFGYSFGGATALSLAGAEINFTQLEQDCTPENKKFNISLLYQCRALELPRKNAQLKDDRIRAIFLFVPFGKSVFGRQGMEGVEIPVFWQATDEDILTPLVLEQIPGFAQLTTPTKYLAVGTGIPHTRVTFELLNRWMNQDVTWEDLKELSEGYHNTFGTAFFKAYLNQDQQYLAYLNANYARQLGDRNYPITFVRSLP
ncbi:MAG: alpha/beta hydrolase [Limnospira sp.]